MNAEPIETAQGYYDALTSSYLNHRNDENAKCKEFRIVLEHFFEEYVVPDQPENTTFAELQAIWNQRVGDSMLNRLITNIRVDLNHVVHGDKSVTDKGWLDYYFKACVNIIYRVSGEDPDERTMSAFGRFNGKYLESLNEQQRDIILDDARIVYVNAGPGSGKTHLLVYKIVDLMVRLKSEARIVAMSYTRSSAASLSAKLMRTADGLNLLRESVPYSGTIHSYCLNSLKDYYRQKGARFDYSIADEDEIEEMVDDIYYVLNGVYEREAIAVALRKPDEIEDERLRSVAKERKTMYSRISVGEILSLYYNQLKTDENFVEWTRKNVNFLLVDEAQDLTAENYMIFDVLLEKIPDLKLFLVGDPRQNIFGFLGGSYRNLNEFLKKYEGSTSQKYLSYSYRCPQEILDFTNTMEFTDCDNVMLTSISGTHGKILVNGYDDEYEEAKSVVKYIKDKGDYANTAILAPRLRPLSKIVSELNAQGIAFVVKGGSNSVKPHIQAFCCMNKFVETNGRSIGAANNLCEKLEMPKCRTLQEFCATKIGAALSRLNTSFQNSNITYKELADSFEKLCREYLPGGDREEQNNDFQKLRECIVSKSSSPKGFSKIFKYYRRQFESREVYFRSTGTSAQPVTISTIHSAKGLEWDNVILPCMSDNYFPYKKTMDSVDSDERQDGLNTDRKLLFVAVTRAKKELAVTYSSMIRDSRTNTRASRLLGALALM